MEQWWHQLAPLPRRSCPRPRFSLPLALRPKSRKELVFLLLLLLAADPCGCVWNACGWVPSFVCPFQVVVARRPVHVTFLFGELCRGGICVLLCFGAA